MMFRRCLALTAFAFAIGAAHSAQNPPPSLAKPNAVPAPAPEANPADNLNLRFANGIVAVAEDKIITVADITRQIAPLVQQMQQEAKNQKEFDEKLANLQNEVIQEQIDRVLMIKEFRKDEKKHIPDS